MGLEESSRGGPAPDGMAAVEVEGNRLTLIADGPERRAALLALIDGAKRDLSVCFYIFTDDADATAVRDALIAARRRGVAVTLLVDAFGAGATPEAFWEPLKAAGVAFARFGARRSTRYLIRNHQKIAIADASQALVGGFNVEASYFAAEDDPGRWCDLGLCVEGPAVAELQRWFDGLARWTLGERPRFRDLRRLVRHWHPEEGKLQWLIGGPTRRMSGWARQVKHDLDHASRIDMVAAYFSPGPSLLRRLGRVARRGSARLILARRSDNMMTVGAARHLYRRLLRSGVAIHEYEPAKLHMKCIVIDDIVHIGSANFDLRSLFLNMEIMLRIEDAAFARQARALFERTLGDCERIDGPRFAAMAGPVARLRWWISYLLVGVLDYTVTRRLNFRSERPEPER